MSVYIVTCDLHKGANLSIMSVLLRLLKKKEVGFVSAALRIW